MTTIKSIVAVTLLAVLIATPASSKEQLPIPTDQQASEARSIVNDLYVARYHAAEPLSQRLAIVQEVVQAVNQCNNQVEKYVLATVGKELAIDLGDVDLLEQAIEQLALFDVDSRTLMIESLGEIVKTKRSADCARAVGLKALDLAKNALKNKQLDPANECVKLVKLAASRARDASLLADIREFQKQLKPLEDFKQAEEILANDPGNRKAKQIIGEYLCFSCKDWFSGLPYLADGSDQRLATLATRDLEMPEDASLADRQDLADAWFEYGQSLSDDKKDLALYRASNLYYGLLHETTGLKKKQIETRIVKINVSNEPKVIMVDCTKELTLKEAKIAQKMAAAAFHVPVEFTNSIGLKFRFIPAGTFMMGSSEDEPGRDEDESQHLVRITKPFYMSTERVTVEQYKQFDCPGHKKMRKVGSVNWLSHNSAFCFCKKLTEKEGSQYKYTLPSEAQWEYAARAGSFVPQVDSKGNQWEIIGLGQMRESCSDYFDRDFYKNSPEEDPVCTDPSFKRASERGGSKRIASRSAANHRGMRSSSRGFRVIIPLDEPLP